MQKRKNIDMLRFYGGDVRERTDDGVLIDTCKDDLWSDKTAYRTLNALLFDGYENEKERIFKEGNKLNPVFVRRLKDTIKIYTGIFKLMCMEKQKKVSSFRARRVDRKNSLNAYEKGCTQSFVSCSKGGYGTQFANKNQVILLEVEVSGESPYIDFQQKLTEDAIYSYLFNVEISDQPILAKNSKKGLTYGELRILSFLRNPLFNIEEFQKREILLDNGQNEHTVDYSIMRVIEIFYSFVKEPVRIDNLIVTHKYICDVWKNGSKHLYFYTLHNQEHAIVLIQNIVKLINTIDFLKISSIDYYILFLACYLHDISMVKIPACDSFLLDTDKADELAKTLLDSYNEEFNKANLTKNVQGNDIDILSVKKYMLDSYRKIDNYFEEAVRSKHANDSAAEIRKRSELNYLDTSMRELVAEVSEAHGADERDIYGIKSVASKQLISIKFDKILLRLADLLDMSSYRVSKPILYHNVEQMSEESAFHWISHLLTKGYSLRTEYEITDNAHVLAPKNIIEKLVLEIPVNISQMSALTCGRTCKKVGIDRNRLSQQGIVLVCGQECKDNGNQERNCNFLCKWFCVKNENLIKELAALKEYLNRNKNNYFKSAIEIRIKCNDRTSLDARQFEILNEYIGKM